MPMKYDSKIKLHAVPGYSANYAENLLPAWLATWNNFTKKDQAATSMMKIIKSEKKNEEKFQPISKHFRG